MTEHPAAEHPAVEHGSVDPAVSETADTDGANRDRLWILRHGQSLANAEAVIVSAPGPRALEWAGLTRRGREQARLAAHRTPLGPETLVVTSDFARARQTAEIVATAWGAAAPRIDIRLRERCFGVLDEGPDTAYDTVWSADLGRAEMPQGVEPVDQVAARTRALVEELLAEQVRRRAGNESGARDVVLVAHGDVLQITQAWAAGRDPHEHRSLPHLANAQLRRIR